MADRLIINADLGEHQINRNIYGHFAEHLGRCIYDGIWVGEDSSIPNERGIRSDVVQALRRLRIPVLRWPGGCFADEYHWRDGIGPRDQRPTMVNTHWGGVTENNHFGTHEFMDLCDQLGCEPYICGNVGSGTVREMQEWVEYLTFGGTSPMADLRRANGREKPWQVRYWGVGNENWGCGGRMRPEYYADLYRRYQTYCRDFGDTPLFKVACGPSGASYTWTEVLMDQAGDLMDGLALHYYTRLSRLGDRGSATDFDETEWFGILQNALHMDELITRHRAIMNEYDPTGEVALVVDEWGTWYKVEPGTNPRFLYQQNSLRDALVAGVTLNIFNQHADRVRMANIAQTVNVLQAMVLTREEEMLVTPTYHVFEMYQVHHDATLLPSDLVGPNYELSGETIPAISASASRNEAGVIHVSLCNLDPNRVHTLTCQIPGETVTEVSGRVLTASVINAHNTFEEPDRLTPSPFEDATVVDGHVTVELPSKSVVVLTVGTNSA
jgi:alpha-N-arabinofuranosidase